MQERLERAEERARPLISKHDSMSFEERLQYIRENREQYKREMNIIHRYYNLFARNEGYARGMSQFVQESPLQ